VADSSNSQFGLLRQKTFSPLFWAQFGGAFNDNFYKSALLMLFTYGEVERWGLDINTLNNLVAGMLIIPFLLFAPSAGRLADAMDKATFIRRLKMVEIAVMALGALALWANHSGLLLLVIFLTGTQSACFSPLKYAILPQQLPSKDLTGANGLMHTGTSLAIFLGLIAGSVLLPLSGGRVWIAIGALLVAWMGWRASCAIPPAPPIDNEPLPRINPVMQIARVMGYARENPQVFWCIIGASWYWFLGSVYLTQLPNFTRTVIHGAPLVVSFLLLVFLLGICIGALLCHRLSRGLVEPAIVPLGALLVLLAGFDLALTGRAFAEVQATGTELTLSALLPVFGFWRLLLDVLVLGCAGGLYLVPLNALMQAGARSSRRGQVIAANNVMNAIFMIAAAVFGALVLGRLQVSIPSFFLLTTLLHVLVITVVFLAEPVFMQRFKRRFWVF